MAVELITTWETNPTFTREDLKAVAEMGSSNYGCGFSDDAFETDTELY